MFLPLLPRLRVPLVVLVGRFVGTALEEVRGGDVVVGAACSCSSREFWRERCVRLAVLSGGGKVP